MSIWKPTPKDRLILASRLDLSTGKWDDNLCGYEHLKWGDIFRAIDPYGIQIDPLTFEESNNIGYCCQDATKSSIPKEGFQVEVLTAENVDEIMEMLRN